MYHYYVDELSSIYSGWSTASANSWCGESVGCGTTTDDNKEEQPIVAKKQKLEFQTQRRSKRLKDIAQKH